jgi:hypothetical protein
MVEWCLGAKLEETCSRRRGGEREEPGIAIWLRSSIQKNGEGISRGESRREVRDVRWGQLQEAGRRAGAGDYNSV